MDILSLGKASKTLREIKQLDEKVVAKQAESHFKTVDERLDWIEGQSNKIRISRNVEVDLSKGVFDNTELVDEKVQLKKIGRIEGPEGHFIDSYASQGTYETFAIDLGEGWNKTKTMDVLQQIPVSTDCLVEVSLSSDGLSFSDYAIFEAEAPPQARFLKVRATLSAESIGADNEEVSFGEEHKLTMLMENKYAKVEDDKLQLQTEYQEKGHSLPFDPTLNGTVIGFEIKKDEFKKINKLEVR